MSDLGKIYALDAFLQNYHDAEDMFTEMKDSDSELLAEFLKWDENIDLDVIFNVKYFSDGEFLSVEYVLGWIVELYQERKERLNVSKWKESLNILIRAGSVNATRLICEAHLPCKYLLHAIVNKHTEIAKILLNYPYNQVPNLRYSLLYYAVIQGHIAIIPTLLNQPDLDIYHIDEALETAVQYGHIDIITILLKDKRSTVTDVVLGIAARRHHDAVMKMLLAWIDSHSSQSETEVDLSTNALHIAIRSNRHNIVKLLLTHPKVDPSVQNNYAIRYACHGSIDKIIKMLVADPRVDPNAVIGDIISDSRIDTVKLLLASGRVDIDRAIEVAINRQQSEIYYLLKSQKN